jgi:magnesium-transporting ATPase (P-type)
VIEFNSDRKRMSVVLKNPDGKVVVYTKGADSMLWDLMKKSDFKQSTDETLRVKIMIILTHGIGICRRRSSNITLWKSFY